MYKNDDISVRRGTPFPKERKKRVFPPQTPPFPKRKKENLFCRIGKTIISTY